MTAVESMPHRLTPELAARFAAIALAHVTREYPGKMDHVLAGPADVRSPRALHPAFYGSFDWHSCVHGFWLLARILRLFPELAAVGEIRALFDRQLSAENIGGERAYLQRPMQGTFERPYGWAWLLMLAAELSHAGEQSNIWYRNVEPLAQDLGNRMRDYLARLPFPIRAGTHANTAFAASLAIEYGEVCGDGELLQVVRARMRAFFGADADVRAYEPCGNDFHSPILIEAECMRRALERADFLLWLDRFLPGLAEREPRVLFEPVKVPDLSDPQIVHLSGLNLSRAWCWRALGQALPEDDPRRALAHASAAAHIDESLPQIAGDYAGEHWLATYALLALEG